MSRRNHPSSIHRRKELQFWAGVEKNCFKHSSTKGTAILACVEKNCLKHPSTKGSAILACVEKYCFKHPSTKGAAIFGMCRKELLQASIDIFVTKNASRFADDLA